MGTGQSSKKDKTDFATGTGGAIKASVAVGGRRVAGHSITESGGRRLIFMPHRNGLGRAILGRVVFLASDVLFAELDSG